MHPKRYRCPICLKWYKKKQTVDKHTRGLVKCCREVAKTADGGSKPILDWEHDLRPGSRQPISVQEDAAIRVNADIRGIPHKTSTYTTVPGGALLRRIDFSDVIWTMSEKKVLDPEPERESYTCGRCKKDLGAVKPLWCPWCGAKLKQE